MAEIIERQRGDNYPIEAMIKVNGVAIDVTDMDVKFSFKLSDGTGSTTTLTGTQDGSVIGLVRFIPTVEQMSIAGQYKYDIQRDDGGSISTHLSDTMLLSGDVTV